MPERHDVIIIGAGQNSLIAAFYLGRAGHEPLVLERRASTGGPFASEEFHPGFRAAVFDDFHGPLAPLIREGMHLEGASALGRSARDTLFAPHPDGHALLLSSDARKSAAAIAAFSESDANKYIELDSILRAVRPLIHDFLLMIPPEIERPSPGDIWSLLRAGRGFRKLGKKNMQRLLRWGPMAAADFVAELFETELLRAVIAARGICGAAAGPWSAGTTALLLLRLGAGGLPTGNSSPARPVSTGISDVLASAAKQAGAQIRTSAEVVRIHIKDGAANGVALASGEEISAKVVVSGADPKRTFLHLLEPVHLAPSFLTKIQNYRSRGVVARIFIALDSLPDFTSMQKMAAEERAAALSGRIHIGPDIDYLERAFDASKYGQFSPAPYLEATIPSLIDPSLAPAGKHVMSVHVQYAPYQLRDSSWAEQREALADTVTKTLAQYAPDLPSKIVARRAITPLDFERDYSLTGGHISHGELSLDQLFTMRPLLGFARYSTPIRGLFLCGPGTHPGVALAGASGFNASRQILRALSKLHS